MSWGDMGGVGPMIGDGGKEWRETQKSNRIAFNTLMKVGRATGSRGAYKPTVTGADRGKVGRVSGSKSASSSYGGGGGSRGKGRGKKKAKGFWEKEDRSKWFKFKVKW